MWRDPRQVYVLRGRRRKLGSVACLALVLLTVCLPEARAADPTPRISVDTTPSSEAAFERWEIVELHRKLLLRLTQEGFSIVGVGSPADVRIRIRGDALGITIGAAAPGRRRERRVPGDTERLAYTHLEVVQQTTAMVRALEPADDARARESASRAPASDETAAPGRPAAAWDHLLGVGGGAGWRGNGAAGTAELFYAAEQRRGWSIGTEVLLSPSRRSELRVFETSATLTFGRAARTARWRWMIALQGGAMLHTHRVEVVGGNRRGAHVDPVVAARLGAGRRVTPHWTVGVWLAPMWTGRRRELQRGFRTVWQSEAFRIWGGLQAAWYLHAGR